MPRKTDPVVEAVIKNTRPYKNQNYRKQPPIKLGKGCYYVVTFTGQDGYYRANFVWEKDDERYAYDDLNRLIQEHARLQQKDERYIVTIIFGIGWFAMIGLIALLAVMDSKNLAIQAVVGLEGTITGYLITVLSGRAPSPMAERANS